MIIRFDHITDRFAGRLAAVAIAATISGSAVAQTLSKNFVIHAQPRPVSAINFQDGAGQPRTLADFVGKVTVFNIWATWCVPCRQEMPALDRLEAAVGAPDVAVVPVSVDRKGVETVRKFYDDVGIRNLPIYLDQSGQIVRALDAVGLPTTLIVDRDGNEVARVIGPADWDDAEIVAFLKRIASSPVVAVADPGRSNLHTTQGTGASAFARGFEWLKGLFTR